MNNLTKKLFFIIAASLSFSAAHAGGTVGNGGDVIYCSTPTLKDTAEIFDVYEARALRAWKLDLGDASLTVQQKVDVALARFNRPDLYAPGMYTWLKEYADNFWKNSVFVPNSDLTDISDSFAITIPKNCSLKQIAIQIRNPSPFEKRYVVNQDLWNMLDTNNQAALVLHEIIYRMGIESGATNSIGTRLMNSVLFSNEIASLDWLSMLLAWKEAGFKFYSLGRYQTRLSFAYSPTTSQDFSVESSGQVNSAFALSDCESKFLGRQTKCVKLGTDELFTRSVSSTFSIIDNDRILFKKMNIHDDYFNWDRDNINGTSPVDLYELYLGAPQTKFRLTTDKVSVMTPDKSIPMLTAYLEISPDRYCVLASSVFEPLPNINVQKYDGSTYIVPSKKDQACFDLAGNLLN